MQSYYLVSSFYGLASDEPDIRICIHRLKFLKIPPLTARLKLEQGDIKTDFYHLSMWSGCHCQFWANL